MLHDIGKMSTSLPASNFNWTIRSCSSFRFVVHCVLLIVAVVCPFFAVDNNKNVRDIFILVSSPWFWLAHIMVFLFLSAHFLKCWTFWQFLHVCLLAGHVLSGCWYQHLFFISTHMLFIFQSSLLLFLQTFFFCKCPCLCFTWCTARSSLSYVRVFWDFVIFPGFNPRSTQKTILDAALLNTLHYKVWIKWKVEQSREWITSVW